MTGPNGEAFTISAYAWTLTFGGRPSLPNEYRIQMTTVRSPLPFSQGDLTVLLGYEPNLNLFAGFDLTRHRTFTAGSPSVQIDIENLKQAEVEGLSFHQKSNNEIAVGIRPDQFVSYALNAEAFHRYGKEKPMLSLLHKATALDPIPETELDKLNAKRRRVVETVSRLSRDASFRRTVLFAYASTCAVTRMQLRLVEAAHILPVGAPGSHDHVTNGLALSPTYHRAFDAKLIYLDKKYQMQLNPTKVADLSILKLDGGFEAFKAPLGKIFLPPDKHQWPSPLMISKANKFRSIPI